MSQSDILSILKRNKNKWFCRNDLKPLISSNDKSIGKSINRIIKFKNIYSVKVKKGKRNKFFIKI